MQVQVHECATFEKLINSPLEKPEPINDVHTIICLAFIVNMPLSLVENAYIHIKEK